MNLITDIQYFPSVIFYKNSYNFSHIIIEQCETWQKMSFRNRCQIAGAEGVIDLSIPLVNGRDQKSFIRDVRIADHLPWQDSHWKTIVSCYNRSPWFEYYRDDLESLFTRQDKFLWDWNWACLEWVFKAFKIKVPKGQTSAYQEHYPGADYLDWRGKFMPKSRLGETLTPFRYQQVFEERIGFQPNLSVLDLLFCAG